jgi:putative ABC transport system ATP-binding protein
LSGNPRLILADEPTASLDADSGGSAMRVLKELCRELGKTVVVVTHDSRIYSLADRVLSLADGRIVGEEPTFPRKARDAAAAPRPGARPAA